MIKYVAAAVFFITVGAAGADPIEGVWQTEPDNGAFAHVAIAPCGNAYCGTIQRAFKGSSEIQSSNTGRQIVIDMVAKGGGNYDGKIWRPANNKIYMGKIKLSGDRMSLSGCVAGGLLCKSQTWARVN